MGVYIMALDAPSASRTILIDGHVMRVGTARFYCRANDAYEDPSRYDRSTRLYLMGVQQGLVRKAEAWQDAGGTPRYVIITGEDKAPRIADKDEVRLMPEGAEGADFSDTPDYPGVRVGHVQKIKGRWTLVRQAEPGIVDALTANPSALTNAATGRKVIHGEAHIRLLVASGD